MKPEKIDSQVQSDCLRVSVKEIQEMPRGFSSEVYTSLVDYNDI